MDILGGLIVVLGFLGLAKVLQLVERSLEVIRITRSAAGIVSARGLSDLQKEKALQKHAKELLILFFVILGVSLLAIGIPLGAVWLLDALGLVSFDGVIKTISSAWFILASLGITLFVLFLTRRNQARPKGHTQGERTLQGLAFEPWFPRVPLSKIESRLFQKDLATISIKKPVFITALPRAGTTLLLELCVGTREFASHTYSDMPFLLTPLLWERFSKGFRKTGELSERIHGDGILVNEESPESFEEILWKEFWPSYYLQNRIIPWSEAAYPEFEVFFRDHMRKVIHLRSEEGQQARYVSKNNLNIARTGYLGTLFPDATILVLFREPLQHAASLLKQHRNFLRIHKEDPYTRKYMEDTGHFDFGENLRPIDFRGWLGKDSLLDPNGLGFWIQYWINTYSYLLDGEQDRVRFFSFDSLCEDPQGGLERLGGVLRLNTIELLLKSTDRISMPTPHEVDTKGIQPSVLDRAVELYSELEKAASL